MNKRVFAAVLALILVGTFAQVAPVAANPFPSWTLNQIHHPNTVDDVEVHVSKYMFGAMPGQNTDTRVVWTHNPGATAAIMTKLPVGAPVNVSGPVPNGSNACSPTVSNNFVVWQETDVPSAKNEIWSRYMGPSFHAPVQVSNQGVGWENRAPQVESERLGSLILHRVVWQAKNVGGGATTWEIFERDFYSNGSSGPTVQITNDNYNDITPQISCGSVWSVQKDHLVWSGRDTGSTNNNIYCDDVPLGAPFTPVNKASKLIFSSTVDNFDPHADPWDLVWMSKTTPTTIWHSWWTTGGTWHAAAQLSNGLTDATYPKVRDKMICWQQMVGNYWHVWERKWPMQPAPADITPAATNLADNTLPDTARGWVTWQSDLGGTASDIWEWRSASGAIQITDTTGPPPAGHNHGQKNARAMTSGVLVVWQGTGGIDGGADYEALWCDPATSNQVTIQAEVPGVPLPYLSFTIEASAAPDGGTCSDDAIDFGKLAPDTPKTAAQRLIVSTDATMGYSVTAEEYGPLVSDDSTITDVTGDNGDITESKSGDWGMPTTHGFGFTTSGDDVVFNTGYRQFADVSNGESAQNVMANAGPVDGSTAEVDYKINVGASQDSGVYNTTVDYAAVGNF